MAGELGKAIAAKQQNMVLIGLDRRDLPKIHEALLAAMDLLKADKTMESYQLAVQLGKVEGVLAQVRAKENV